MFKNIICVKIFLNINKDFLNFKLAFMLDQLIILVDLINFIV